MDLSEREGRREQGQRIQSALERAGISIEDAARRVGCSRALIYQYLSGATLAQPDKLQQIAKMAGVPLDHLYSDTRDADTPSEAESVSARVRESLDGLVTLADAQEAAPDYRALADTCERMVTLAAQLTDSNAAARAWHRLGNARLRLSEYATAVPALERALALASALDDTRLAAAIRQSLGHAQMAIGRLDDAAGHFEALAAGSDARGRWQGNLSVGAIAELRGDYRDAMVSFDRAAASVEQAATSGTLPESETASANLYINANRANVFLDMGDIGEARSISVACEEVAEELGNADQHLEARFNVAWCDFMAGRWGDAHAGFRSTWRLARFVGDEGRAALCRAWLGIVLAASGNIDDAVAHGKDAFAAALAHGDRRTEIYAHLALCDGYLARAGREIEGAYHVGQALAIAQAQRQQRHAVECRLRCAAIAARQGDIATLAQEAAAALEEAEKLGAEHLAALAHAWCAEAAVRSGGVEAASHAGAAATAADRLGIVEARWRAHDLMGRVQAASGDMDAAVASWRLATDVLLGLRSEITAAGQREELLEIPDCAAVFERSIAALRQLNRPEDLSNLLERCSWPPFDVAASLDTAP